MTLVFSPYQLWRQRRPLRGPPLLQPGVLRGEGDIGSWSLVDREEPVPLDPGQRLAAADNPGYARALRSTSVDGMTIFEGAPVIGIALAPLDTGTGLIPILVTLR